MKLLLLCAILVFCITNSYSAIISSSGLQRKSLGESCKFQWTVTGTFKNYEIHNLSTGNPTAINSNSNSTFEQETGIITLTIRNIQLSDAGNYSLSIVNTAVEAYDASALLFVFGKSVSFINQTYGPTPAMEGDTVELTCTVIPTSLPVAYRTKIYYFWQISLYGNLQNISSGPAVNQDGDEISGYNIKNNGRTVVIVSAQYSDAGNIGCWGQEEGSSIISDLNLFYLTLNYRPHTYSWSPPSRKFNAIVGRPVLFYFSCQANPPIQVLSNWTFVNTAGKQEQLPSSAVMNHDPTNPTLSFNFTTENYYGNYSVSLSNSIGNTTETFQVLPPGRPDKPSDLRIQYISHIFISLQLSCMWGNGREQNIFVRLTATKSKIIIETQNTTVFSECYNLISTYQFTNNIQPDTDYEATAWATSVLGSSDFVKLAVTTPSQAQVNITPKDIIINGNEAVINYTVTYDGKIKFVSVSCCVELTGEVETRTTAVQSGANQFVYNDLPVGDVFIFDVTLYGGSYNEKQFYLTTLKGIKVFRTHMPDGNPGSTKNEDNRLLVAVIVLAVILGVAILALLVCLIVFLVFKCRKTQQPPSKQQQETDRPYEILRRHPATIQSIMPNENQVTIFNNSSS